MQPQLRLVKLLETPIRVFYEEAFDQPEQETIILSPIPNEEKLLQERTKIHKVRDATAPEIRFLYEEPLLSRKQESHLFRQLNFLKHKALKLIKSADILHVNKTNIENIEVLLNHVAAIKRQLVCSNARLVMNLAKKSKEYLRNNNVSLLSEMVSDGNVGIVRAIDYFDYRMGNKFSTYAGWAIIHTMRTGRKGRIKYSNYYVSGFDDLLDAQVDESEELPIHEVTPVQKALAIMDEKQKKVLVEIFGLDGRPAANMRQIGERLGVSKQTVRVIREKGISFLREKLLCK